MTHTTSCPVVLVWLTMGTWVRVRVTVRVRVRVRVRVSAARDEDLLLGGRQLQPRRSKRGLARLVRCWGGRSGGRLTRGLPPLAALPHREGRY